MRHMLAAGALVALAACTADDQGERFAVASPCGAADVKGIIGYPLSHVHLPYGADRLARIGHYDPRDFYTEAVVVRYKSKPVAVFGVPEDDRMNILVDAHGYVVDVICF